MSSVVVNRYTTTSIESLYCFKKKQTTIAGGAGSTWSIGSIPNNTSVNTTTINTNTSAGTHYTKNIWFFFDQTNLLTSYNGIPSTKCKASINGNFVINASAVRVSGPGGLIEVQGIHHESDSTWSSNSDLYLESRPPTDPTSGALSPFVYSFQNETYVANGSGVSLDTPSVNTFAIVNNRPVTWTSGNNITWGGQLDSEDNWAGAGVYISQVSFDPQGRLSTYNISANVTFNGTVTRTWEGINHYIDGTGGDTIPTLSTVSTFSADATVVKDSAFLPLTSAFTFVESSANRTFGTAAGSSEFAITVTPLVISAPPIFLESSFEVIASTNNLVFFDDLIVSSEFNTSSIATMRLGVIEDFPVTANASTNAGLIYDLLFLYTWNSFNLNTFFISGYVIEGYSDQDEYTWDDLANDSWDLYTFEIWEGKEQSWDGWPYDVWGRTFDLPMVSTTVEQGNIVRDSVANFLGQFFVADNSAFQITGFADLSSQFELVAQPKGVLTGESSISSESSVEEIGNVILGGSASVSSALSFSIDVKLITDIIETENSVFSFVVDATIKRTSSADVSSQFTVDATGARIYRATVAVTSAMAFAVEVTFVTQADPYFTIKVPQEIRTHVVPADSRVLLVCQENRVNTPVHESRVLLVEQETRLHYLLIPPLTNIKSTPYERAI